MKQLNKSLCNFIESFQLEYPPKGICFEAKIYFHSEKLKIQVDSEIHIVTITAKGLDVLYLVSPNIGVDDFPDMYLINDLEVSYTQQEGLFLKGSYPNWGVFDLVVQPINKNCSAPTFTSKYNSSKN